MMKLTFGGAADDAADDAGEKGEGRIKFNEDDDAIGTANDAAHGALVAVENFNEVDSPNLDSSRLNNFELSVKSTRLACTSSRMFVMSDEVNKFPQ